jgi:hypothetical protein
MEVSVDLELKSELADDNGKISIDRMLQVRRKLQSGTSVIPLPPDDSQTMSRDMWQSPSLVASGSK